MKFIFRKKAYLLMAVLVVAVSLMFPVDASASPVILGISTTDIRVGDSFTVSVAGTESSNLSLHYDGTMVTLTGQNGASLDGNTLTVSAQSASFTFQAKQEGNAGFVASSDKYDRSSAVVTIAAGTGAANDDTKTEADTTTSDSSDQDTSDESSTVTESTDTSSVSDSADTAASSDEASDTADLSKHGITSSDLSFRQLILDRRMILVIAVLLAIIIILIIRLTTLHYAYTNDYDDDDIDFDEAEKKIADKEKEDEQNKLVEHVTEKKSDKKPAELDLDDIDEEKLTMPKAPRKPNEKLKLEDLNDL